MRSILLHVQQSDSFEAQRQVSFDIARQFGGHVTCLQSVPIEAGAVDFYGVMASQMIPIMKGHAEETRKACEPRLSEEDVPWDWLVDHRWSRSSLRDYAPLNDLVVMSEFSGDGGDSDYRGVLAEMAAQLRTPVLVVPQTTRGFATDAPIVIPWNGSAEAANAMRAAVPLLQKSKAVMVLSIQEKRDGPLMSTRAAAAYLSRHDVSAEIFDEPPLKDGIAETIAHFALQQKAGCIVMGAYGRSRLSEMILGGVSRAMIRRPPMPLFLSH